MNFVHQNFKVNENFYRANKENLSYFNHILAKSKISREKLNRLQANSGTPLNRAFFVRRFHTPQENRLAVHQSMMACSRQPLMVGCFPVEAVSHPATRYRQTVRSLAIAFNQLTTGLLAMIYQFLGISRQHYDQSKAEQLRILADNEAQARAYLAPNYVLVKLGQLPDSALNLNTILLKGVING
ncbi:hypothetical protein JP32_08745 [Gallibacterium anatis]|uniref:Uncharacterized protein n=2 Tax=Gallibacterium anatis TaxID=750 RepID=A0A0A2XIL3_9PAST|nr:hypothetical protein JP32_08745 [Gallibacterium anatis]